MYQSSRHLEWPTIVGKYVERKTPHNSARNRQHLMEGFKAVIQHVPNRRRRESPLGLLGFDASVAVLA